VRRVSTTIRGAGGSDLRQEGGGGGRGGGGGGGGGVGVGVGGGGGGGGAAPERGPDSLAG